MKSCNSSNSITGNEQICFKLYSRMMWYSNLPCFDVHGVTSHVPHEKSILKACYWKGNNIPCAAIFYPIHTDRGMCCAFNMNPLNEIFNGETYVSLVIFRRNPPNESLYLKWILYIIKWRWNLCCKFYTPQKCLKPG